MSYQWTSGSAKHERIHLLLKITSWNFDVFINFDLELYGGRWNSISVRLPLKKLTAFHFPPELFHHSIHHVLGWALPTSDNLTLHDNCTITATSVC
jgi:hypothetical protein